MSVIKFLKWAVKIINSHMSKFFWNDQEEKHKYHLSNWRSLCQKKEYGGLGIPDLRELNLCLLASWVQRFYNHEPKIWKEIVRHKYHLDAPNIFCCRDRYTSPFLKGVLWVAQAAKMGFRWKYGDGRED
jgi:hypothetical protein